jgi:AcrR family transcriptional regulator
MSPRRRHPHSDDVRSHLLNAALRVFAHRGYDGASVRDIAAEAGLTPGLLYHYFPSKQAVLEALFARSGQLVMQAFAHVAGIAEPREQLGELIRVSARIVRENEEFWRISYGVRFQRAVLDGLAVGIAAQSAIYLQLFTELLTRLGHADPAIGARLLFATLDGIFQHYVLDPATYPLDPVIERLIRQYGGSAAKESS